MECYFIDCKAILSPDSLKIPYHIGQGIMNIVTIRIRIRKHICNRERSLSVYLQSPKSTKGAQ